jgi:hypothetical protein
MTDKPQTTPTNKGSVAVFTDQGQTVLNVNDGGFEIECKLSPREAFRVAGQIFGSAVRTATQSGFRRVRGGPSNG